MEDVCVIGVEVTEHKDGEIPKAFVVLKEGKQELCLLITLISTFYAVLLASYFVSFTYTP